MNDFDKAANEVRLSADKLVKETPRISILAANRFLVNLKRRVFFKGKDRKESSIGKYSTKSMLVGSTSFTNLGSQVGSSAAVKNVFGSKKKRASRKWVTVGGYRLAVLEGGYAEFRKLVGRKVDKVTLFLTGDLFRSIISGKQGKGAAVGINRDKDYQKAIGNEKRFGKIIFAPSDKDEKAVDELVGREVQIILDGRVS